MTAFFMAKRRPHLTRFVSRPIAKNQEPILQLPIRGCPQFRSQGDLSPERNSELLQGKADPLLIGKEVVAKVGSCDLPADDPGEIVERRAGLHPFCRTYRYRRGRFDADVQRRQFCIGRWESPSHHSPGRSPRCSPAGTAGARR